MGGEISPRPWMPGYFGVFGALAWVVAAYRPALLSLCALPLLALELRLARNLQPSTLTALLSFNTHQPVCLDDSHPSIRIIADRGDFCSSNPLFSIAQFSSQRCYPKISTSSDCCQNRQSFFVFAKSSLGRRWCWKL